MTFNWLNCHDVIWNNQRFTIFHPETKVVQGPTFEKSRPVVVKGATHLSREDEDKFDYYEVVFEPDDAPPLGLRTEKGHFSWGKIDRDQMVRYHTNWWSSKTDVVIIELSLMSDLILAGVFLKSTSCIFSHLSNEGTKQVTNSFPPHFPIKFPQRFGMISSQTSGCSKICNETKDTEIPSNTFFIWGGKRWS